MNLDKWKKLYLLGGREFGIREWGMIFGWRGNEVQEEEYLFEGGYLEAIPNTVLHRWRFMDKFIEEVMGE